MKKSGGNTFVENVGALLNSIAREKKELRHIKNEELKKLGISEREQIKLIKLRTKQQKERVIERYERRKENLGKTLLGKKNQELGKHLSIEKKSLNKTNKAINKVKRNQIKLKN